MAIVTSTQNPDTSPAIRFFGVETEYPIVELDAGHQRLDPGDTADRLMRAIRELVPYLHCGGELDVFTANGSRVYVDIGMHPEVATPECSTPEEAVLFTRAGDRLLAQAARRMERDWTNRGKTIEAVVWKANADYRTKTTWGSHESYLHKAPQSVFSRQLISHLVTRIIYTGAGGFNNRAATFRFAVSPRAFHLERVVSSESTHQRGVFHTRDEPLAEPPNRRLHVLAGESLWSETADYLRIGTTALLVAQIDAGRRPQSGLDMAFPLQALAAIAADTTCTAKVKLENGDTLTAIAIQRRLLESIEVDLGADHLPSWAASVCKRWREVLDSLEVSPRSLIGVLDWPTKLAILERQCEADGLKWDLSGQPSDDSGKHASSAQQITEPAFAARLLETELQFTRLDDSGIFAALDRSGSAAHRIVVPDAIEKAIHAPPRTGRARIRAATVHRLANRRPHIVCSWDRIVDLERDMVLHLGDPFKSAGGRWVKRPPAPTRSSRNIEPAVAPIAEAIAAQRPRQALARMHTLIAETDSISPSVCRYCINVIRLFVPNYPVPVLRRGGATAGPVLTALFENAVCQNGTVMQQPVGTLLYRFHESQARYDRAALVVERLLAQAREEGNGREIAMFTNNLGYEHMLAGQWLAAENLFEQAIEHFEEIGAQNDVVNGHANLLECHFSRLPPEQWGALVPTLRTMNRALTADGDWRARKTLRLLARYAEHRGHQSAARGWMRRAVAATKRDPTQLRDWDKAYLEELGVGISTRPIPP
jgi:tetratricopeptide (TPR) repeat protein